MSDKGKVAALVLPRFEVGGRLDDPEAELFQKPALGPALLGHALLLARAVVGNDSGVALGRLDLFGGVGDVLVEVRGRFLGVGLLAGGLPELLRQLLPRLLRIVDDDRRVLGGYLLVMVDGAVRSRARDDHEVGIGRNERLLVEFEVGVEDVDAFFLGDGGPLGEEAFVVGYVRRGRGGRGLDRSVDRQKGPREGHRRRHDSLRFAFERQLSFFVLDFPRPGPRFRSRGVRCPVRRRRVFRVRGAR